MIIADTNQRESTATPSFRLLAKSPDVEKTIRAVHTTRPVEGVAQLARRCTNAFVLAKMQHAGKNAGIQPHDPIDVIVRVGLLVKHTVSVLFCKRSAVSCPEMLHAIAERQIGHGAAKQRNKSSAAGVRRKI